MIKKIKLFKVLILMCLILTLLTPVISFSDNSTTSQKYKNTKFTINNNFQANYNDGKKYSHSKLLEIVKKYSPETLNNWEKVLQKNNKLRKELFKLYKQRRKLIDSNRSLRKAKKIEFIKNLKEQVKNNEITKEEAKEKIKQYRCQYKINDKKSSRKNKQKLELYKTRKALMQAVKENDANEVKSLLDKLYINYKNLNTDLNNRINKIKKEK